MKRPFRFLCFLFSLLILSYKKELNILLFYYLYLHTLSLLHIQKRIFLRCRGYKDTDWIKFCTYPTHQSSPEVNCESWNVFPTCCESAAAHESLKPKVSCVKTTGFTQDCFVWISSWMAFMFFHFKLRKNYMKMEEKTKEGFLQIEKQNPVS